MEQQVKENLIAKRYPEAWKNRHIRYTPLPKEEQKPIYDFFKRAFDIAAAFCALILLSWVIGLAALAIKLEDGGPVIYSQVRVGKDGRLFKMYKMRSMRVGAEKMKKILLDQNEMDGPVFKMENDPRITNVGKWLRRSSIDELPQCLNILKGDMSIVGPRPPLGHEVMQYDEYAMRRLTVKPGLTCYWQCSGRSDIDFDEWMQLDNKYINERGMWTDIKMIFKTIPAVFKSDGAC
ncbi:MAG: sugar transferase [Oscillospiraceae bacterium]|nr:sugar transferase [Oscillospiraceae bacterium]